MRKRQILFSAIVIVLAISAGCNNPESALKVSTQSLPDWLLIVEGEPSPKGYDLTPPRSLGGTRCPDKLSSYLKQHHGWMVSLQIHIDPSGKALKAACVSEDTEMSRLYAEWAKTWNYQPAKSNGKSISCIWQINIPQTRSTTTTIISTSNSH
jgi:hypothetical protein